MKRRLHSWLWIVSFCICAASSGCGGTVEYGYLYWPPSVSAAKSLVYARQFDAPSPPKADAVTIVGVRGIGDNAVVIDVLLMCVYKESQRTPGTWFQYQYNGFAWPAAHGEGFTLRLCDGPTLRQMPVDWNCPPPSDLVARYHLSESPHVPTVGLPDGIMAQVLPVFVAYDRPIAIGSCVQVSIDPVTEGLRWGGNLPQTLTTVVQPLKASQ